MSLGLLALVCGCGSITASLSGKSTLTVGMEGVYTAPTGASGNDSPRFMTFTLENISLNSSGSGGNGAGTIQAFAGPATDYRIIDRPQIIYTYDAANLVGQTITSVTVYFSPTVVAGGKYEDDLSLTLSSAQTTYAVPFTVSSDKDQRFDIDVQWLDTVTRDDKNKVDTLTSPTLDPITPSS